MAYQFYNDTATLKIVENGQAKNLTKSLVSLTVQGDDLVIGYDSDANWLRIHYTSVTVPVVASAEALRSALNGYLVETISATIDTTGLATSANQTNGDQKTQITDGAGVVNTKQLGTALTSSDVGLITNTTIHGLSSSGGGTFVDVKVNPAGKLEVNDADVLDELQTINSLIPSVYDYISLTYTGSNVTGVVYKLGGSGGTTISTLTLGYSGNNLISVTKT